MKHFWALPAFLRLATASSHQFNVFDDLLAFPQYEVLYPDTVVSEDYAESALSAAHALSATTPIEPHPTPDSSLNRAYNDNSDDPKLRLGDDIATYEDMTINGQRYLCSIPRIAPDESTTTANQTSPEEEEKELVRATTRGWELLKGMEENCLYFFSGWWSYSFCHGEGVRQFHQLPAGRNVPIYPPVEDKSVHAYVLGRFQEENRVPTEAQRTLDGSSDSTPQGLKEETPDDGREMRERGLARLETKGEVRYLVQKLKGGTTCDLTGKERRIEVQFHCQPNNIDRITMIKETATCQYLMVISTPRLCHDVAFLPPEKTKPHAIACTPVIAATAIPSYLAAQEKKAAELDAQIDNELSEVLNQIDAGTIPIKMKTSIIGGIEIGGYNVIPKGKKIQKSTVVGGGKEKLIATIAKSDGFVADEKLMKNLGIQNGREVEGVKKEVERVAAGKGWRLDVVETARGKELRGVIEAEDEKPVKKEQEGIAADDEKVKPEGEEEQGSEEGYKEEL